MEKRKAEKIVAVVSPQLKERAQAYCNKIGDTNLSGLVSRVLTKYLNIKEGKEEMHLDMRISKIVDERVGKHLELRVKQILGAEQIKENKGLV